MLEVHKTVIDILKSQPNRRMNIMRLALEMSRRKILGFGVETEDVVYELKEDGLLDYNSNTGEVILK